MSYCRWGEDSDVYVYPSVGGLICCGCPLVEEGVFTASTPALMLNHLQRHREVGHKVPEDALVRLRGELK